MEANPTGATNIDGAVDRLSAMFNPEPEGQTGESAVEAPEVPQEETEVEATAVETPEGDTETEVERYKVKVQGEETEVTLDELRKGYMMESDYRKKTTDVNEMRGALETKEAQIDAQISEAKTLIEFEISNLESPEMLELKQSDPDAYIREADKVQGKVDKFNKLKEKRQVEQQAKQTELTKKELEALETAIPEWLDPDVRAKEANEVFAALEQQGFSRDELQGLTDHRVFVLARKAMMFDQIDTQDLESKKVRTPPKSQKPGTSQSVETKQAREAQDLRGKLRKSGSAKDAAKLFRSMIK